MTVPARSPGNVVIRRPRPGDGRDLARCWRGDGAFYAHLAPHLFRVPDEEGLAEWMEQATLESAGDDNVLSLVAEVDGRVVGFAEASIARPIESADRQIVREVGETRVMLNALGVREDYRRRGIGSRLVGAVEAWGRERGATLVALDTWIGSPVSLPFYDALGYERRQIAYRKPL